MTYLWFIKFFMAITVGIALFVWGTAIRNLTQSDWSSATFVLLLGAYWWSVYTLYSGMETPLVVLLMGVCLLAAKRLIRVSTVRNAFILGLAAAATFLARLDSVFFLGTLAVFVVIALRKEPRILAAAAAATIVVPIPYLWWNLSRFGSLVPVSGRRKSVSTVDFAAQFEILAKFAVDKATKLVGFVHPIGAVLIAFLILAATWVIRRELADQAKKLELLWCLPIAAVLHFTYTSVFMIEADVNWYQYTEYLTAFLFISTAVAAAATWVRHHQSRTFYEWIPWATITFAVLGVLFGYAPRTLPVSIHVRSYETAVWARAHLEPRSLRFGMIDPGIFRFVSEFNTVALNGLAGDRETMELANRGDTKGMIRRHNIDYIVSFIASDKVSEIPSKDAVFASDPFKYLGVTGKFVIVRSSYWIDRE